MIKKSDFEEKELAVSMQQELRKVASGEPADVAKATEYLRAAVEILENNGLQRYANKLSPILEKIANPGKKGSLTRRDLKELGITDQDLKNFGAGHPHAKMKVNHALRRSGLTDQEIANFIGTHNMVKADEVDRYFKMLDMIKNPTGTPQEITMQSLLHGQQPPPPGQGLPSVPEEITMESLAPKSQPPSSGEELTFKSIGAPHKPRRPDKIPDTHTKGLTPAKMVANLKHHGTEFNMPDLSWSDDLDPEIAHAFDANSFDELNIDDILDAEIDEDMLEASEQIPLEDFEDEVSVTK